MDLPVIGPVLKKIFGSANDRMVARYLRLAKQVSELESSVRPLTDAEIKAKTGEFRSRLADGASISELTPEIFAVAREAMDRAVGIRAIFDPERGFDPSTLPENVQSLYAETKAAMDAAEAMAPEGAFRGCEAPIPGWCHVDIPNELYEAVRTLHPKSKPPFRSRPFDVQIIGAMVLSEGKIAEMKTGEGKTIVAPLAAYRAVLEGHQVHVVTVNDYLVQRDRDWTFPFFRALGMTVGAIHPQHEQTFELKSAAYRCDVVYGTTSEFGFDYLRDNMKPRKEMQFSKTREFAIVDEVDSTLIDEARTPLIISGPAHDSQPRYELADRLARHLMQKQGEWAKADDEVRKCVERIAGLEGEIKNSVDAEAAKAMKSELAAAKEQLPKLEATRDQFTQYYEVEEDKKKVKPTTSGIEEAQREAKIGSFYQEPNTDMPHLLEQAIRAHAVYVLDRDYVVMPDPGDGKPSVIIVDQNTGRKMVGRQWSDGLHQAVEAKERVPIKPETQTMATVTIQNFFKMYDRLAGMTGTADTEATEFHEIYALDVVVIPTNLPIARQDRNDVVYMQAKDKYERLVDEIAAFHDLGRPVLVGTTSVEKSEMLSQMLTQKHNIRHEVLNARHHEREADIVASAGHLGAVTIATNMAGRGTDIKLQPFTREALVDHWKKRNVAPKDVRAADDDETILSGIWRHLSRRDTGDASDDMSANRLAVMREWIQENGVEFIKPEKAQRMTEEQCLAELDKAGYCALHRISFADNTRDLGGLHVIGTERHESRRVDNQLRGRSGRQGDPGSSRFYLSLEDDLMAMFASDRVKSILRATGMKEGVALQAKMLTGSISRSQKKVEERNFLIRKNILEYDEVMDHQRHDFYERRQAVIEDKGIRDEMLGCIERSVEDAVQKYLDPGFARERIADWASTHLHCEIDPDRVRLQDAEDVQARLRAMAKEDASSEIDKALGEFLPADLDREAWSLVDLADWLQEEHAASVKVADLMELDRAGVRTASVAAAHATIEAVDMQPIEQWFTETAGVDALQAWMKQFMGSMEIDLDGLDEVEDLEGKIDFVLERVRTTYADRVRRYPIRHLIERTGQELQADRAVAMDRFCKNVALRYDLDWTPQTLPANDPRELLRLLDEEAKLWDDIRFAGRVEETLKAHPTPEDVEAFVQESGLPLNDEDRAQIRNDAEAWLNRLFRRLQSFEMDQLERTVLLQVLDDSWKDHLHKVDMLRESISFRSFSQRDPKIEFKREASRLYDEMLEAVDGRVGEMAFNAQLRPPTPQPQAQPASAGPAQGNAPQSGQAAPPPAAPRPAAPPVARPATAAVAGAAEARRPGGAGGRAAQRPANVKIGRNEMVTVMNPTTGEKQEMKFKKAEPLIRDEGWRLVPSG